MDIKTGENYRQFMLLIPLTFIGEVDHSVGGSGWEMLARYKFHVIRVHDNLVLDPSNYKSSNMTTSIEAKLQLSDIRKTNVSDQRVTEY